MLGNAGVSHVAAPALGVKKTAVFSTLSPITFTSTREGKRRKFWKLTPRITLAHSHLPPLLNTSKGIARPVVHLPQRQVSDSSQTTVWTWAVLHSLKGWSLQHKSSSLGLWGGYVHWGLGCSFDLRETKYLLSDDFYLKREAVNPLSAMLSLPSQQGTTQRNRIKANFSLHLPDLECNMKGAAGSHKYKRRKTKVWVGQGFLSGGFSLRNSLSLSWLWRVLFFSSPSPFCHTDSWELQSMWWYLPYRGRSKARPSDGRPKARLADNIYLLHNLKRFPLSQRDHQTGQSREREREGPAFR